MSAQAGILLFSEDKNVIRELAGKAGSKGSPVAAAVFGNSVPVDGTEFATWGIDTVYTVQDPLLEKFNPETYVTALAGVIEQVQPDLVLVGASKRGLEVAGRVCERLNLGCASWCVDFEIDTDSKVVTAQCGIFSGQGIASYKICTQPALATVTPGTFAVVDSPARDVTVTPVSVAIAPPMMTVVEDKGKMTAGRRLEDAPVIVDVGMGVKERADLAMAEALADLLNGQVACTRPVSSDRDWFPEWLGLSGAQLRPELCITVGVSGAIQHVIGIRGSKIIVGINTDPDSSIMMESDYGIVADLYEVVPALIEALKTRSVRLAE